jgi:hypothetical protein
MLFSWLRRRRRRKLMAQPFPDEWRRILRANVRHYALLSETERRRLEQKMLVFVAEKHWEGIEGQEVTDEVRVTIAALACLMLLGTDDYYFDRVDSIIVVPGEFERRHTHLGGGLVGHVTNLGESLDGGPVKLAWDEVLYDAKDGHGTNLVIHEFAHKLDEIAGFVDGTPPLPGQAERRWEEVAGREYERLVRDVEHGRPTLLDPYGAESRVEFFAVASECFFEEPRQMREEMPELYGLLCDFYRLDPAAWDDE